MTMTAGPNAGDFMQVLIYVLIFGGAIVAEIVKHLKRKKLQQQLESQRGTGGTQTSPPPAKPQPSIDEELEEEAEEPEVEGKPTWNPLEELFGPLVKGKGTATPTPSVPPPVVVRKVIKVFPSSSPAREPSYQAAPLSRAAEYFQRPSAGAEHYTAPSTSILGIGGGGSDLQRMVVWTEILAPPRAVRRYSSRRFP